MSSENKDSIIKSSEQSNSFPLFSTPFEELAAYIAAGGSVVGKATDKRKTYMDPVTGLKIPRRLDDPTVGV